MKRINRSKMVFHSTRSRGLASIFALLVVLVVSAPSAKGQTRSSTVETNDYVVTLPSVKWRSETEPGIRGDRIYFFYADADLVELHVRRTLVDTGVQATDLAQERQRWDRVKNRGYVTTGTHKFGGELDGAKYAYEYVAEGKVIGKVVYYLQTDIRTIYRLEFTGSQAKLLELEEEIEFIARSFRPQ